MSDNTYLTNNDGEIIIKNLKQDTIIISAEHSNYYMLIDSFNIEKDSLFTIPLFPKMARVVFTVSDSVLQIKDAIVSLGTRSGTTNNEGIVAFYEQPTRETYIYEVFKEGYETLSDSIFLKLDTTIAIDLNIATNNPNIMNPHEVGIYPNPCNDELVIHWPRKQATIAITNMQGYVILKNKVMNGVNKLDISGLKQGFYMVSISLEDLFFKKTIIKK
jgi:hypothetical protein